MLGRRLRHLGGSLAVATLAVAAACAPMPGPGPGGPTTTSTTTTLPGGGGAPVINAFGASRTAGPAPLTTAFTWTISDPDADPLSCGLDLDDDGSDDITITSCTSTSVRSATFALPGSETVRLSVSDGTSTVSSAPVALSVGAASADAFGITLRFNGTLTPSQAAAFDAASDRWEQIVRTGLADVTVNAAADACGTGAPAFAGTVDDLLIDASVDAIDGPGGILGQAGPCLVRSNGGLPAYGAMLFDSADLADLEADGQLEAVILHEMGHVLGFGTVWDSLLASAGTTNPRFIGLVARGSWSAIAGGSGTSVPVEGTGGPGTADSHWRESVFDSELMTGFLDSGATPLSAVTIGALADIGYGVDLGAADAFGTPALRATPGPQLELEVELLRPVGTVG